MSVKIRRPPMAACVHGRAKNCRSCAYSFTLVACGVCGIIGPNAAVKRHCSEEHNTTDVQVRENRCACCVWTVLCGTCDHHV